MNTKTEKALQMEQDFYTMVRERSHAEEDRLNAHLDPQPVACDYDEMTSVIEYLIQPWMRNPAGDAHGGTIAAMFDTAMGFTAFWVSKGSWTTTVDMNVNYISPMPCGDFMVVSSNVQKAGRTLIRVTAEARAKASGKLVATASANFMMLK